MAVAAANAVALCPDGNEALSGSGTTDPSPGSASGGRARPNSSLSGATTSEAIRVAAPAARKASGARRRHTSQPSPSATSNGPLTHHAESTTNIAVSTGCSNAGADSINSSSRSTSE